jgi:putative flippase GtrA
MARNFGPAGVTSRLWMLAAHPETRRVFSFLLVGGICAVFNLAVLSALTLLTGWTYLYAALVAAETSVLLGFILNDRITFRALALQAGGWPQRCLRFHLAAAMGQALTLLLGFGLLHIFARMPIRPISFKAILAQAISLIVVTAFNFISQRFLTYASRIRTSPSRADAAGNAGPVAGPVSMYEWARLRPPLQD